MKIRQKKYQPAKKAVWWQASVLSWLLLGIWLAYSAAALWTLKVNTVEATSMCITRR